MIANLMTWLGGAIITAISAGGYAGVVALMALESACIPLPSEVIMPFAGYLVSTGRFGLFLVATAGAVGCNIGSTVAFEVGARGGRPLVERWGARLHLNPGEIEWADRWFERRGSITVLIGRLLPIVRTFIALPAGIARMNRGRFHVYTFVGSWFWCLALAYIGRLLSGSGVVTASCDQGRNESAKQGFATSACVVHELEEAEVKRQLVLREASMRAQPGTQQRPEALMWTALE
jgi:membrane protein DedA with SNARE-associated domain